MKTAPALAALLATVLLSAGARAQELGRLFFTPEQRAALDARRKARVPDKPAAVPQAESPVTRVDGVVQRGGGRSTVWVNNEPIPEGAPAAAGQPAPSAKGPGRVSLPVGESAQRYDLRVGESLDRGSGEVKDVLGEGELKIKSRAAPKSR